MPRRIIRRVCVNASACATSTSVGVVLCRTSSRGYALRTWAAHGQRTPSRSSPNSKSFSRGVPSASDRSSLTGLSSSGAPLFQRPTSWAPSSSADAWSAPDVCRASARTDASNSGTFCASRRNTRKDPWSMNGTGGATTAPSRAKSASGSPSWGSWPG